VKAENSSGTAWAAHGNLGKGCSCASNLNRSSVSSTNKDIFRFEPGWGCEGKGRRLSSLPLASL